MTSEHVIPDGMIRRILMALKRTGKVSKTHTAYDSQPTIMVYHGAGSEKTGGTLHSQVRGQDQNLITRFGNVVAMIRSSAGGSEMGMRKRGLRPQKAECSRSVTGAST